MWYTLPKRDLFSSCPFVCLEPIIFPPSFSSLHFSPPPLLGFSRLSLTLLSSSHHSHFPLLFLVSFAHPSPFSHLFLLPQRLATVCVAHVVAAVHQLTGPIPQRLETVCVEHAVAAVHQLTGPIPQRLETLCLAHAVAAVHQLTVRVLWLTDEPPASQQQPQQQQQQRQRAGMPYVPFSALFEPALTVVETNLSAADATRRFIHELFTPKAHQYGPCFRDTWERIWRASARNNAFPRSSSADADSDSDSADSDSDSADSDPDSADLDGASDAGGLGGGGGARGKGTEEAYSEDEPVPVSMWTGELDSQEVAGRPLGLPRKLTLHGWFRTDSVQRSSVEDWQEERVGCLVWAHVQRCYERLQPSPAVAAMVREEGVNSTRVEGSIGVYLDATPRGTCPGCPSSLNPADCAARTLALTMLHRPSIDFTLGSAAQSHPAHIVSFFDADRAPYVSPSAAFRAANCGEKLVQAMGEKGEGAAERLAELVLTCKQREMMGEKGEGAAERLAELVVTCKQREAMGDKGEGAAERLAELVVTCKQRELADLLLLAQTTGLVVMELVFENSKEPARSHYSEGEAPPSVPVLLLPPLHPQVADLFLLAPTTGLAVMEPSTLSDFIAARESGGSLPAGAGNRPCGDGAKHPLRLHRSEGETPPSAFPLAHLLPSLSCALPQVADLFLLAQTTGLVVADLFLLAQTTGLVVMEPSTLSDFIAARGRHHLLPSSVPTCCLFSCSCRGSLSSRPDDGARGRGSLSSRPDDGARGDGAKHALRLHRSEGEAPPAALLRAHLLPFLLFLSQRGGGTTCCPPPCPPAAFSLVPVLLLPHPGRGSLSSRPDDGARGDGAKHALRLHRSEGEAPPAALLRAHLLPFLLFLSCFSHTQVADLFLLAQTTGLLVMEPSTLSDFIAARGRHHLLPSSVPTCCLFSCSCRSEGEAPPAALLRAHLLPFLLFLSQRGGGTTCCPPPCPPAAFSLVPVLLLPHPGRGSLSSRPDDGARGDGAKHALRLHRSEGEAPPAALLRAHLLPFLLFLSQRGGGTTCCPPPCPPAAFSLVPVLLLPHPGRGSLSSRPDDGARGDGAKHALRLHRSEGEAPPAALLRAHLLPFLLFLSQRGGGTTCCPPPCPPAAFSLVPVLLLPHPGRGSLSSRPDDGARGDGAKHALRLHRSEGEAPPAALLRAHLLPFLLFLSCFSHTQVADLFLLAQTTGLVVMEPSTLSDFIAARGRHHLLPSSVPTCCLFSCSCRGSLSSRPDDGARGDGAKHALRLHRSEGEAPPAALLRAHLLPFLLFLSCFSHTQVADLFLLAQTTGLVVMEPSTLSDFIAARGRHHLLPSSVPTCCLFSCSCRGSLSSRPDDGALGDGAKHALRLHRSEGEAPPAALLRAHLLPFLLFLSQRGGGTTCCPPPCPPAAFSLVPVLLLPHPGRGSLSSRPDDGARGDGAKHALRLHRSEGEAPPAALLRAHLLPFLLFLSQRGGGTTCCPPPCPPAAFSLVPVLLLPHPGRGSLSSRPDDGARGDGAKHALRLHRSEGEAPPAALLRAHLLPFLLFLSQRGGGTTCCPPPCPPAAFSLVPVAARGRHHLLPSSVPTCCLFSCSCLASPTPRSRISFFSPRRRGSW
ncbi:unnamed protein product [Closterium sp. Naga37s-1]|nr:unnamed protein product [Closterium sp. Naga37s-1]